MPVTCETCLIVYQLSPGPRCPNCGRRLPSRWEFPRWLLHSVGVGIVGGFLFWAGFAAGFLVSRLMPSAYRHAGAGTPAVAASQKATRPVEVEEPRRLLLVSAADVSAGRAHLWPGLRVVVTGTVSRLGTTRLNEHQFWDVPVDRGFVTLKDTPGDRVDAVCVFPGATIPAGLKEEKPCRLEGTFDGFCGSAQVVVFTDCRQGPE